MRYVEAHNVVMNEITRAKLLYGDRFVQRQAQIAEALRAIWTGEDPEEGDWCKDFRAVCELLCA